MKHAGEIATISKCLLIILFLAFALYLTFYALVGLTLPKAKNENIVQIILVFMQCFILPISFYTSSAILLIFDISRIWKVIVIVGAFIVLLNIPNVATRLMHISLYLLALVTYFLQR